MHQMHIFRSRGALLPDKVDNKIKILFLAILVSCDNVEQNTFESLHGWFELTYPGHWTQFDEEDGTYLFMDNDDWKGNLRITAMRIGNDKEPERIKRNLRMEIRYLFTIGLWEKKGHY